MNSVQNNDLLMIIEDYTIQYTGDYNNPIGESCSEPTFAYHSPCLQGVSIYVFDCCRFIDEQGLTRQVTLMFATQIYKQQQIDKMRNCHH